MPESIKSFRHITENYTGKQVIVKGLANIMYTKLSSISWNTAEW